MSDLAEATSSSPVAHENIRHAVQLRNEIRKAFKNAVFRASLYEPTWIEEFVAAAKRRNETGFYEDEAFVDDLITALEQRDAMSSEKNAVALSILSQFGFEFDPATSSIAASETSTDTQKELAKLISHQVRFDPNLWALDSDLLADELNSLSNRVDSEDRTYLASFAGALRGVTDSVSQFDILVEHGWQRFRSRYGGPFTGVLRPSTRLRDIAEPVFGEIPELNDPPLLYSTDSGARSGTFFDPKGGFLALEENVEPQIMSHEWGHVVLRRLAPKLFGPEAIGNDAAYVVGEAVATSLEFTSCEEDLSCLRPTVDKWLTQHLFREYVNTPELYNGVGHHILNATLQTRPDFQELLDSARRVTTGNPTETFNEVDRQLSEFYPLTDDEVLAISERYIEAATRDVEHVKAGKIPTLPNGELPGRPSETIIQWD